MRSREVPLAIIYRPSRNVMQSGPRSEQWVLKFEPASTPKLGWLMGYVSTRDPYSQIEMKFPDRQSAIEFAEYNDWNFIVRDSD